MKCPSCKKGGYNCYSVRQYPKESLTVQYRECKNCGYQGKTTQNYPETDLQADQNAIYSTSLIENPHI